MTNKYATVLYYRYLYKFYYRKIVKKVDVGLLDGVNDFGIGINIYNHKLRQLFYIITM